MDMACIDWHFYCMYLGFKFSKVNGILTVFAIGFALLID